MISFVDVTKRFHKVLALDRLSFDIPGGRLTGFLGPNGAGKTTSFRIALGLTRLDEGIVDLDGLRVGRNNASIVKRVGAIVEDPGLHAALTGRDNMRVAAAELGTGATQIDRLLDLVGLAGDDTRKVAGYSKGMRQRLGVAMALLGDPDILMLDEPLDGLDPSGQVAFKQQLRHMVDDAGKTVVVSSHDLADVEELADHVVVVDRGRLVVQGPKTQLLEGRDRIRITVDRPADAAQVLAGAGFRCTSEAGDLVVETADGAHVSRVLAEVGLYPSALVPQATSLQEVFLRLTGEAGS